MKLEVEKHIVKEDGYDTITYKIIAVTKCCDEILDEDYIVLGADDEGEDYEFNLINEERFYVDSTLLDQTHYKPIKYCPFCGKPLEIVIDDTFDNTEEYNKLCNERNKLRELYEKTDSVNEREKLRRQLNKINREIGSKFYESDRMEELIKLAKGGIK